MQNKEQRTSCERGKMNELKEKSAWRIFGWFFTGFIIAFIVIGISDESITLKNNVGSEEKLREFDSKKSFLQTSYLFIILAISWISFHLYYKFKDKIQETGSNFFGKIIIGNMENTW